MYGVETKLRKRRNIFLIMQFFMDLQAVFFFFKCFIDWYVLFYNSKIKIISNWFANKIVKKVK
jgi:hypothetical protein